MLLGLTLDKTTYGWTSPLILGLLAVAAVATVLFLFVETRVPSPIIALRLFRNRVFAVTIVSSVLNGAAFFGAILFLSLFMVNVLGVSATAAGTALIPLTLSLVVGSILASFLVEHLGRYKPIILIGFAVMLIGFFLLWRMPIDVTHWGVTWRMIVLGFGIGPALPLFNLALQNAVPFQDVGSATASRQFFQQLGQAFGAAIFGVILTTTLTSQITANLKPIVAELLAEMQSRFDPSQFRQSRAGGEGTAGGQVDIGSRIGSEITAQFAEQRTLLTAALQDNDPQAQAVLINNPKTPSQLKELLGSDRQEPARSAALKQALAGLDTAEDQAAQQGQMIGIELTRALRQSFATSITSIYLYAMWLVGAAFLLILLGLPELPLRTSNSGDAAMPVFE